MVGPKIAQLLVIALPSLVLAFAVFMGGYAVSATAGDKNGGTVFWWLAAACLVLLVMDAIALLVVLGFDYVARNRYGGDRDDELE